MKQFIVFLLVLLTLQNTTAQDYTPEQLQGLSPDITAIQKPVQQAFLKMKEAAKKEGISLQIVSGFRSFERQKAIWNRKYNSYTQQGLSPEDAICKIIEYSTFPGTSRHHWGTDIDIIDASASYSGDVLDPKKFHGEGPFSKLKQWMDQHANTYGFYLVYTKNPNRKGFYYEPWHYSYKPIAVPMLEAYTQLDIAQLMRATPILGKEHLSDEFLEAYINQQILDINPELKTAIHP